MGELGAARDCTDRRDPAREWAARRAGRPLAGASPSETEWRGFRVMCIPVNPTAHASVESFSTADGMHCMAVSKNFRVMKVEVFVLVL